MSAPLLMLLASLLFALMAVCVKFASAGYGAGEIVLYRSLIGLALMAAVLRGRGVSLKAPVPAMHFWRSLAGTAYAIGSTLVVASLQYRGIVHSFGLGVWLFHDPVTAPSLVGTGLILLAGLSASFFRALAPAVIARDLPSRSTDS